MPAPSQYYPNHDAMCCICFGPFNKDELYVEQNGDIYDICVACAIDEAYAINRVWNKTHQ